MKIFSEDSIDTEIMSDREFPEGLIHDGRFAIFLESYAPEVFGYALQVFSNCADKTESFAWLSREDLEWLRNRIDTLLSEPRMICGNTIKDEDA